MEVARHCDTMLVARGFNVIFKIIFILKCGLKKWNKNTLLSSPLLLRKPLFYGVYTVRSFQVEKTNNVLSPSPVSCLMMHQISVTMLIMFSKGSPNWHRYDLLSSTVR